MTFSETVETVGKVIDGAGVARAGDHRPMALAEGEAGAGHWPVARAGGRTATETGWTATPPTSLRPLDGMRSAAWFPRLSAV